MRYRCHRLATYRAVPISPPRRAPYWPVRTFWSRVCAYCSVPLRIDIPPRRAPYWPVQTVSAGGFPKARFTLVVWQCSVWHRSLLGLSSWQAPCVCIIRRHLVPSRVVTRCCRSQGFLLLSSTVQYCLFDCITVQYRLTNSVTRRTGWCRLLTCTAVGRSDTQHSAPCCTDGLLTATHRT